jgi:hypothetical protein
LLKHRHLKIQNTETHSLKINKVLFELATCDKCDFLYLVTTCTGLFLHDLFLHDFSLIQFGIKFTLQQHWFLLSKWVRNVKPHYLANCKKLEHDNQYWREIRCNKPTLKKCTNCLHNVRLAHTSIHTIRYNADRIKQSAKCLSNIKCHQSETGNVCLCSKTTTVLSKWTIQRTMDVSLLHLYWIINKCNVQKCMNVYCIETCI